jgi:hypothetical protein
MCEEHLLVSVFYFIYAPNMNADELGLQESPKARNKNPPQNTKGAPSIKTILANKKH